MRWFFFVPSIISLIHPEPRASLDAACGARDEGERVEGHTMFMQTGHALGHQKEKGATESSEPTGCAHAAARLDGWSCSASCTALIRSLLTGAISPSVEKLATLSSAFSAPLRGPPQCSPFHGGLRKLGTAMLKRPFLSTREIPFQQVWSRYKRLAA